MRKFICTCCCLVFIFLFTRFTCHKTDLPVKTTLDTTTEYIKYTINGVHLNFYFPSDTLFDLTQPLGSGIWGRTGFPVPPNPQKRTYIFLDGTPTMNPQVLVGWNLELSNAYFVRFPAGVADVTMSEFGDVGQYLAGSFGFLVKDTVTSTISPMTCTFRVKRNQ